VPSPAPLPQQKVCSRIVFSGISWKFRQTLFRMKRGSSSNPMAREGLQESW